MSDLERFNELVDDVWEIVFGTKRRLQVKDKVDVTKNLYNDMATTKKPKQVRGEDRRKTDRGNDRRFNKFGEPEEPKRARTKDGRYRGDIVGTKDINEAWVGGKAPKKNVQKNKS
jgi:hypothetical protein